MARKAFRPTLISLATAYADQGEESSKEDDEFVIPEDLSTLADEDLEALHTQAQEHFDALYRDGKGFTPEELAVLAALTDGIEAMQVEIGARQELAAQREAEAAALAARIRGDEGAETEALAAEGETVEGEASAESEAPAEEPAEAVVASAVEEKRPTRIPLASVRSRAARAPMPAPQPESLVADGQPKGVKDVVFAAISGDGLSSGQGVDFEDLGKALDKRLASFPAAQYEKAHKSKVHLRDQQPLAVVQKPFPEELTIRSKDPRHIEEVLNRATDESRLPQGSLVASGGWCAPSEVLYDLIGEVESRDGLLSLPEVTVDRGGISFTRGPDFADIFSDILGFSYTEQDDIDGTYAVDANGVGTGEEGDKPCYKIECPPFVEYRLGLEGLCLTAGLLQQRGYPEVIARTIRGALVAHDHRVNGRMIAAMVNGSTAITLAANQVGATAPILTAIELQVEHYRASRRMARDVTLEAVFPLWVHGAIRSDLSRQLGIDDKFSISNAQITGWFRERGVNPQFVYNWQDIAATAASSFTAWPSSVSFLLYAAGTWIRGTSDVITIDTLYDSVQLAQNDYTALFTEEGVFTARRGQDSRVITVPICPDGATAAGVDIACNGSAVPVTVPGSSEENPLYTQAVTAE